VCNYRGRVDESSNLAATVAVPTVRLLSLMTADLEYPKVWLARNFQLVHYTKLSREEDFRLLGQLRNFWWGDLRQFLPKICEAERNLLSNHRSPPWSDPEGSQQLQPSSCLGFGHILQGSVGQAEYEGSSTLPSAVP